MEYDTKAENAKPVKLTQYCNQYKNVKSINDISTDGNSFNSVSCICEPPQREVVEGSRCNHLGMLTDPFMVGFVTNS